MMIHIQNATISDAVQILALQKIAYQSEAELYQDWTIPPLTQTLSQLEQEFENHLILMAILNEKIVGSVRAYIHQNILYIGRLMVHPQFQKQGIGSQLLTAIEKQSKFSIMSYLQDIKVLII